MALAVLSSSLKKAYSVVTGFQFEKDDYATRILLEQLQLKFKDEYLTPDQGWFGWRKTLSSCQVEDGSTLILAPPPPFPLSIEALYGAGKSFRLEVQPTLSIKDLKCLIREKEGVDISHQVLTCQNEVLRDDGFILDYKIDSFYLTLSRPSDINVFVKISSQAASKPLSIAVNEEDTIEVLKSRIDLLEIIDVKAITLDGKMLNSWCTIAECGVKHNSTLLFYSWDDVLIQTPSGKTIGLDAEYQKGSIGDIKSKIREMEGYSQDEILELLEHDWQLKDTDSCPMNSLVLDLLIRFHGDMEIYVRLFTGKTICLSVSEKDTIRGVKCAIQEKEGIPSCSDYHHLVYEGMQLKNHLTLSDYNIQHGVTLHLELRIMHFFVESMSATATLRVLATSTMSDIRDMIKKMNVLSPQDHLCWFERGWHRGRVLFSIKQLGEGRLMDHKIRTNISIGYYYEEFQAACYKDPESIKIVFRNTEVQIIEFCRCCTTILAIKHKFHESKGFPLKLQQIFLNGEELEDEHTLQHYNIHSCDVLTLKVDGIYIIPPSGKTLTLKYEAEDTIADVKEKVLKEHKISPSQQTLLLDDKELENELTLNQYSITRETTLHLVVHSQLVNIETLTGEVFSFIVNSYDTIEQLKAKILGVPWDEQKLVFKGKELIDGYVYEHNIQDKALLQIQSRTLLISVKTTSGREVCSFEVPGSTLVEDIKSRVLSIEGSSLLQDNDMDSTSGQNALATKIVVRKEDVSYLVEQLHDYSYKWRRIGIALRFRWGELQNIYHDSDGDTTVLLAAVLDEWTQWPTRTHCTAPTLERLCAALRSNTVGLGAEANSLYSRRFLLPSQQETRKEVIHGPLESSNDSTQSQNDSWCVLL